MDFSTTELLQFALKSGSIDLSKVADELAMKQRTKILGQHKYAIKEGRDGRWYTYVPDKEKGRRQIRKPSEDALKEALVKFYQQIEEEQQRLERGLTFQDCYNKMFETHCLSFTSDNTICKYQSDYRRFFEGTDFEVMGISDINEEIIRAFVLKTVKAFRLPKKSCRTLCGYIRNTLKSARINRVIADNPFDYIEVKDFYPQCTETIKTPEERTISDAEMALLYERFHEDYLKRPTYIPTLAVEFASLTGFRVGELAVLKWEDISDDCIIVSKSEKFSRITGLRTVGETKTRHTRTFPLTDEIKDLLKRIWKTEEKYGYLTEFVFSDENGRIFASKISDCAKVKSRQAGIPTKTIHSYRRTISSKLKCNGVPSTIVSAMMGHSEQVNEQYYTYDVSDMQTKKKYMQSVTNAVKKIS